MKRPLVIGSYLIHVAGYLAAASLCAYLRGIQLGFALCAPIFPVHTLVFVAARNPIAGVVGGGVLLVWFAALVKTIVDAVRRNDRKRPLIVSHLLLLAYLVLSFLLMLALWGAATMGS